MYQQAEVMAQWGKADEAMAQAAAGAGNRRFGLSMIATDPLLDPIAT